MLRPIVFCGVPRVLMQGTSTDYLGLVPPLLLLLYPPRAQQSNDPYEIERMLHL